MSDTQRCSECSGKKKVMGLGLLIKDCPTCEGIGWVKKDVKPFTEELVPETRIVKRKGRPPKNVETQKISE